MTDTEAKADAAGAKLRAAGAKFRAAKKECNRYVLHGDTVDPDVLGELRDKFQAAEREYDQAREAYFTVVKEAGAKIDPATVERLWDYGSVIDPYGTGLVGPDDEDNIGRNYFVRAPGTKLWIHEDDLPAQTRMALNPAGFLEEEVV